MGTKTDYQRCNTRLYRIWSNMKDRCKRSRNKYYHRYGGRGIDVCKEWANNFYVFEGWAYANGYREYLTLDRIDNDKGYSPNNCKWSTQKEQARNRSKSIFVTINGERRNIQEWSEISGISAQTIRARLVRGDKGEDLIRPLHTEVNKHIIPTYTINGKTKTAKEWADEIGISRSTFNYRWKNGLRGKELLKPNRNH